VAEMYPVGNTIQPPPPINALQSLSGILGIKQQQQNLQTGKYTQETAQAGAQQADQRNQELQAVGNLTKNAYSSGRYKNGDGSFNNQLFANDVAQVAPTYGQEVANAATMRAGEIYKNQQTLFGLNDNRRKQIGDTFGALAAQVDPKTGQPTVTHSQLVDAVEQLREQNPNDKDYSRMLTSVATSIPPDATPAQLQQSLRNMAVATNSPTSGQTNPAISTMQGPEGLQAVQTNTQAPGGVQQVGPTLKQGLSPAERLPHQATTPAGIVNITPQGAISAPPQAGAAPPGVPSLNPSAAQAATSGAAAAGIAQRVQQAKAADYDRPAVLDALTRVRAILANPNAPKLGSSFEAQTYLKNALSSMGVDTKGATDANELVKNLARSEAARSQSSPIGTTDAGRSLLSKGTGSTHIDNAAALGIVDQSIAAEMAGRGYLKAVTKYAGDPDKMQQAETSFLQTPHLIHAYELGLKKSPAEVESFKKQNGLSNNDLGAATDHLKALGAL
jgi:hypothetical protein